MGTTPKKISSEPVFLYLVCNFSAPPAHPPTPATAVSRSFRRVFPTKRPRFLFGNNSFHCCDRFRQIFVLGWVGDGVEYKGLEPWKGRRRRRLGLPWREDYRREVK